MRVRSSAVGGMIEAPRPEKRKIRLFFTEMTAKITDVSAFHFRKRAIVRSSSSQVESRRGGWQLTRGGQFGRWQSEWG